MVYGLTTNIALGRTDTIVLIIIAALFVGAVIIVRGFFK